MWIRAGGADTQLLKVANIETRRILTLVMRYKLKD
jgi:hypothetical protein